MGSSFRPGEELSLIHIFLFTKGEYMANELIEAIQKGQTMEFRAKYRQVDVLLIDDIQFISGKVSTQEEFFHTFDALHQANKQIVLTSDRPPREIATLEERLRTRFEMGLLADIQPPDLETRIAIIRRKAQLLDIPITDDIAEYIAGQLKSNVRQLEGAVKCMRAQYLLAGEQPTLVTAQNALSLIHICSAAAARLASSNVVASLMASFSMPVPSFPSFAIRIALLFQIFKILGQDVYKRQGL